jgi:RNA polymerase sigma factor (sigma-70 family)
VTRPRVSEQKQKALTVLWEQEASALLRRAWFYTGEDESSAYDLVQEVFVVASEKWPDVPSDPIDRRRWMNGVMRHKAIDRFRRAKLLTRLQLDLERTHARETSDPADVVIDRESLERCRKIVRGLPHVRQKVALLYFESGLSAAEISEALEIKASGVRKHIAIVRAKLCAQMRNDEWPAGSKAGQEGKQE